MRRYAGIALIVLVALNLRPAIVAVGPLLSQIQDDLHLSGAAAGALTTLPLVFFGSFGLVLPLLKRAPRGEPLLVASMLLLVVGMLVRVLPSQVALFGGALLAGIAISVGNIAVPSIIKRDHPQAIMAVTSVYTIAVTVGAAVSSSVAVPIEHATGSSWRLPLALLAIPAALAAIAWLPRARTAVAAVPPAAGSPQVWRSGLAWQITAFMGIQSLTAYVVSGWLPTLCQDRGLSETAAGYALGVTSLLQAVGALAVPVIERRLRDQRPLVVLTAALGLVGFAGTAWAPIGSVWLWIIVLGLGQGIGFATALSFIGLRAPDAHVAAQLSGMAQGVGYVIAALGPLAIGAVHDATHGWSVPSIMMLVAMLALVVPGLGAGRTRTIGAETEPVLVSRP
ncbi:MFS transporter [Actinoallomurus purpureus]|uniref:CynX/NimT family MFS transporter n=1 Tax=Actinoallomurus purpureus TaxID=478114 RepID=UPI0020933FAB|nr:MFS transporter [Actinoallomurus purpureus]MCO6004355.1 MFS transporter [Actinoallomurus purpureus]